MIDKTWTVTIEEDPETGDLVLPIPEEILFLTGWKEGDELTWDQDKEGNWVVSKKEPVKKFEHVIKVKYTNEVNDSIHWNETCAMVVETFGLPGDRYMYRPHVNYMTFEFETEHDALLCRLLLSDRL